MRISDWSSDVCSSDLGQRQRRAGRRADRAAVQADFETGFARDDGGVLIKALHDCGGFLNSASSRRGTMTNWNRPTRTKIAPMAFALLPCNQLKTFISTRNPHITSSAPDRRNRPSPNTHRSTEGGSEGEKG